MFVRKACFARLLSLADDPPFEVYTSPSCLAIGAYYAEKKNGRRVAEKKAALLAEKLKFTTLDHSTAKRALADNRVEDLEDGMEYYSVVEAKCSAIVTYDRDDFHFSALELLDGEESC